MVLTEASAQASKPHKEIYSNHFHVWLVETEQLIQICNTKIDEKERQSNCFLPQKTDTDIPLSNYYTGHNAKCYRKPLKEILKHSYPAIEYLMLFTSFTVVLLLHSAAVLRRKK